MGASTSIDFSVKLSKQYIFENAPGVLKLFDFDKICDESNQISGFQLKEILESKHDVFLSHDWGDKQLNHKRVAEVNRVLKSKGINTWFDEEQMANGTNLQIIMPKGIDNSSCVLVFVTEAYMHKVGGDNQADNCLKEFSYASLRKPGKMLPIVMERTMQNPSQWQGPLGFNLGQSLYIGFTDDSMIDQIANEVVDRVKIIIGDPLSVLEQKLMNSLSLSHSSTTTATQSSHAATVTSYSEPVFTESQIELQQWFVKEIKMSIRQADIYVTTLDTALNIASLDKFKRKINKSSAFLSDLKVFDEDDIENIVNKLNPSAAAAATTTTTTAAAVAATTVTPMATPKAPTKRATVSTDAAPSMAQHGPVHASEPAPVEKGIECRSFVLLYGLICSATFVLLFPSFDCFVFSICSHFFILVSVVMRIVTVSGDYEDDLSEGEANGQGTLKRHEEYVSGHVGEWKDNHRHGHKEKNNEGNVYDGEWKRSYKRSKLQNS